jgi:hypothetical protein
MIVSDTCSELTSNAILTWADQTQVEWHYIAGQGHAKRLYRELQWSPVMRKFAILAVLASAGLSTISAPASTDTLLVSNWPQNH